MKPKKYGSIAVSQVKNRKLYNKIYYELRVMPNRKKKDPIFLIKDVFSGMLITKKQLQKPINESKIVLREGCNYLNPFSLDKYKQKAEEEMEAYFEITTKRSLEYLDLAILRGYTTKDDIRDHFGLKESNEVVAAVSNQTLNFVESKPTIKSLISQSSESMVPQSANISNNVVQVNNQNINQPEVV